MSSLPEDDVDAGSGGPPVAWWTAASPAGGDVVLSGAVLLFLALAFAFVVYHYFTVSRRGGGGRDSVGVGVSSGAQQRGTFRGGDAAVSRGGVDTALLRALPLTVYRSKDRGGEALECAVCLAELADGEAARFLPRCGHGFHAECVDLWLRGHPTCPLCRVDVDKTGAPPPAPSSLALPPALPEPANYPTNLPTNVLFWGSQYTVTTAAAAAGPTSSSRGPPAALVIEVRDRETALAVAPTPREGDAAKAQGLAMLSSLRRLWNRGRHDAAAASSSSCRQGTACDGTEQAPAPPLDIWNLT
ncbi:E3 ubiquitin-protein ligase EL5-like [Panicum miliaceum]|uniref:RING-type E3 ubiquitin transferase n=1 Tax=Panicum miliaceum TaxID=4540 RepID=A0A3L6PS70_PANMI|nr:E3 ubiquitin-protein ligase EL5-like [Panicum miliaceum]